jgi:serine/threonine-protein kinase Stk1
VVGVQLQALAVPLLDALAHVHQRGIVHGDLKPGNVMLTDTGPVIVDFGLAEPCEGFLTGLPRLGRGRFDAWTPGYAAPELLDGAVPSLRTDIYAIACVLYELANGKPPFGKMLSTAAREQRLWHSLGPPSNLPIRFWPALRHALTLDARNRTISAQELRDAFCVQPIGRLQL